MVCSTTVRTLNKATGEGLDFRARPTLKGLVGQLEKVQEYFGGAKRTHHYGWLARTIESCTGSLKVNLSLLFRQLKTMDEILAGYCDEVEALAATPGYQKPVKALTCYSFLWGEASRTCLR